ncbi:helix-turn-helix domain-containing protein [Cellulomonas palmilytica]|uniref:helix-turn-helix domain-containing protein n=1 Tax=Cellulomonas palmilytica TaxID=2608402 RepID=UPI001F205DAF|nr:helix-turn-helix transcriptional regulator [Cellulomonas palmilytica]UJP39363.1 helix-turn-helix transcriptional regulator [Cellulomonas palmilytica]
MATNRNGLTTLDEAVAEEVRAEIARQQGVTVTGIADTLGLRRATLSARLNGHIAFSPSLLGDVAQILGLTASEITRRAEHTATVTRRAS